MQGFVKKSWMSPIPRPREESTACILLLAAVWGQFVWYGGPVVWAGSGSAQKWQTPMCVGSEQTGQQDSRDAGTVRRVEAKRHKLTGDAKQIKVTFSGGFRGSGRGGVWTFFFLSGIRFPHQPKGSPLVLLYDIHYRPTYTKNFLKVHMAPIYNNFAGGRAPEKKLFFLRQNFLKKRSKTDLELFFFQKFFQKIIFFKLFF